MNVICPQCSTTYRVDPAKVPSGGVLAQCARCPATFEVEESGTTLNERVTVDVRPVVAEDEQAFADEGATYTVTADVFVADPGATSVVGGDEATSEEEAVTDEGADLALPVESSISRDEDVGEGYAGSSEVAFHTEESAPDDLPYLDAPVAEATNEQDGVATPEVAELSAQSNDTTVTEATGADAADPDLEPAPPSSTASGEAPLPPAPFGARSDPHRRAARLARALVSDIVVYHPERRTRSLRQGTLRQEFREEIRKSWEEYANQVGSDFARQTTYFRDALNEILAEGATVF